MQNKDKILTKKFFELEKRLKMLSGEKRRLSTKLLALKKSIEELDLMDTKKVYHKIDSILIPRDRQIVIKDTQETIKSLSSELKEIDKKWDKEMAVFKKMSSRSKLLF